LDDFVERFSQRYVQRPDNVQAGYDAFYLSAYALVVADALAEMAGASAIDAEAIEQGFASLSAGSPIDVGPLQVQGARASLLAGTSIDLSGASSGLDWDSDFNAIKSDVGLWCLGQDEDGRFAIRPDAGPRWHYRTNEVSGSYHCPPSSVN
jgi:hypothetical protein